MLKDRPEDWRANWTRVFDLVGCFRTMLHNCAVEEMTQDDCEEIGSSDINHYIYHHIELCENTREIGGAGVEWAKELGLV